MATRTSSGLVPLLLVIGVAAVFGGQIVDFAEGVLGDITGNASEEYVTGPDGKPITKQCTADQILKEKKCGEYKVIIIDAHKMSYIARNIQLAWAEGKKSVLHRDSASADANYNRNCRRVFVKKYDKGSCDEYAFASSQEGAEGARTEEVHKDEQNCQGGTLSTSYRYQKINQGDAYLVVISNPDKIATKPWEGEEVRPLQC